MARRRADGEPGLIDRVRWRNVGRLAVALVAVLVVVLGPRGCGRREASLPPEVRVAPPAPPAAPSAPPKLAVGSRQSAEKARHRRRRRHRRARKHRARRVVVPPVARVAPAPAPRAPLPAPTPRAAPAAPAPEFF